jgi:peptide/nickel transport system ATP-binding protein
VAEPLLSIRDLCVDYITRRGPVRAVDRVSFDVARGEILGIAGESGSGKTTLAQALLRILPPPAVISGGQAILEGRDLLGLDEPELRVVRWKRIAMVFQSAMNALNPVIPVGEQIVDMMRAHGPTTRRAARARAGELLDMVGMPAGRLDTYAHQLSGGMRQRVCIALALALEPPLLILDEPTTALDVIVEEEILSRIRALQRRTGFSVLFITHDLARMLQFSDRIAVFYGARLAELGPADAVRDAALHPYTQGLLRSFPRVDDPDMEYTGIPGAPPSLTNPPSGCRFHPRCPRVVDLCREQAPEVRLLAPGHAVACHRAEAPPRPALTGPGGRSSGSPTPARSGPAR